MIITDKYIDIVMAGIGAIILLLVILIISLILLLLLLINKKKEVREHKETHYLLVFL